jgi:hypothetical protein
MGTGRLLEVVSIASSPCPLLDRYPDRLLRRAIIGDTSLLDGTKLKRLPSGSTRCFRKVRL